MTTETILTDAEIITIGHQARGIEPGENGYILPVTFARAIEQVVLAKLAEQEPVAWIDVEKLGVMHKDSRFNRVQWNTVLRVSKVEDDEIPLYTHPVPCVSPTSDKTACIPENGESDTQASSQVNLGSSNHINDVLSERGSRYGDFTRQALLSQTLKNTMRLSDNWGALSPHQIEALDMIQHKIARILNGDPNYDDSWRDIAGYATLIERNLNGEDE